jgi:hypothetical protein
MVADMDGDNDVVADMDANITADRDNNMTADITIKVHF